MIRTISEQKITQILPRLKVKTSIKKIHCSLKIGPQMKKLSWQVLSQDSIKEKQWPGRPAKLVSKERTKVQAKRNLYISAPKSAVVFMQFRVSC